jgi:hypothetical protein
MRTTIYITHPDADLFDSGFMLEVEFDIWDEISLSSFAVSGGQVDSATVIYAPPEDMPGPDEIGRSIFDLWSDLDRVELTWEILSRVAGIHELI